MISNEFWAVIMDSQKSSVEFASFLSNLAKNAQKELVVVLICENLDEEAVKNIACSCHRIEHIKSQGLDLNERRGILNCLKLLALERKPEFIGITANTLGRYLAPALGAILDTGVTADCTALDWVENEGILQTRPTFGGRFLATISCSKSPTIASVRLGTMANPIGENPKKVEICHHEIEKDTSYKLLRLIEEAISQLREADIIFAGGLGLGSYENFQKLYLLAEKFGGQVGASRAAVAAGYAPYSRQIGQSGLTVRPKLYLAFGISGASQHIVGITYAQMIVAVNKDPKAAIHNFSDYSVIGDCNKVIDYILDT